MAASSLANKPFTLQMASSGLVSEVFSSQHGFFPMSSGLGAGSCLHDRCDHDFPQIVGSTSLVIAISLHKAARTPLVIAASLHKPRFHAL